MSKIIRLNDKRNNIINYIKELIEYAEKGEIEKIAIVSFLEKDNIDSMDKEILLGFYNLTLNEKFYLLAHLQAELNYKLVEANVDNLIEIINR